MFFNTMKATYAVGSVIASFGATTLVINPITIVVASALAVAAGTATYTTITSKNS